MKSKSKIIIVTPFINGFIQNDIDILNKEYDVLINIYNWKKKLLTPFFLLFQIFFFLKNIKTTDKVLVQFGGYWSLIPSLFGKIFNKPVFIVLHGTDCASIPLINYGSLRKIVLKLFCRLSYDLATILLPVSSSLKYVNNTYNSDDKYSSQGYQHFFPKNKTEVKVIANGLDLNFWSSNNNISKEENSFVAVFSESQFILKGGDLILAAAYKFPNCKFYIVGMDKLQNELSIPKNLYFLGRLEKKELKEYYGRCQFHLQLSIFEGFGLALCEAMLCECIPIGSSVNAIPEIIGDAGFVITSRDVSELNKLLKKVISINNKKEIGAKARSRVASKYSLINREERLLSVMSITSPS